MTVTARIFLASRSPRRRELLTQISISFDTLLFRDKPREDPEIDETPLPGEDPVAYVLRVAHAKAAHGHRLVGWRGDHHRSHPARSQSVGKPVGEFGAAPFWTGGSTPPRLHQQLNRGRRCQCLRPRAFTSPPDQGNGPGNPAENPAGR